MRDNSHFDILERWTLYYRAFGKVGKFLFLFSDLSFLFSAYLTVVCRRAFIGLSGRYQTCPSLMVSKKSFS